MIPRVGFENDNNLGFWEEIQEFGLGGEEISGSNGFQRAAVDSTLVVTPEWLNSAPVRDITTLISFGPATVGKVCTCFQNWVQGASLNSEQLQAAQKVLEASRFVVCEAQAFEPIFAIIEKHLTVSADADLREFLKAKAMESSHVCKTDLACRFYEVLARTNPLSKRTPWHYAAEVGDLPAIAFLLRSATGQEALSQDARGYTALHLAVKNGHVQIVEDLLKHIENLHTRLTPEPYPDYTDLVAACLLGDSSVVACFIMLSKRYEAQEQPDNKLTMMLMGYSPKGKSLAHAAIEANRIDIACQLMAAGFNPSVVDSQGRRPLELLAETINLHLLENLEEALKCWRPADWTLMETACAWRIEKLALCLIEHAARSHGGAPIDASVSTDIEMCQQLLKAQVYSRLLTGRLGGSVLDAIPENQRKSTSNALLEAIVEKESEFVALMALFGMPPSPQCSHLQEMGKRLLALSLKDSTNLHIYKLDENVFLDVIYRYASLPEGLSPLDKELIEAINVIAAYVDLGSPGQSLECVFAKCELLLREGASAKTAYKAIISVYASQVRFAKEMTLLLRLLLNHGADVNAVNDYGRTWLHRIISSLSQLEGQCPTGDVHSLWSLLIRNGARIDIPDAGGLTVFGMLVRCMEIYGPGPRACEWKFVEFTQLFELALQGCTSRGLPYFLHLLDNSAILPSDSIAGRILNAYVDHLEYVSCPMKRLVGPGKVATEDENLSFADYVRKVHPNIKFHDFWIRANRGASILIRSEDAQALAAGPGRFAWSDFLSDEQAALLRLEELCSSMPPAELMAFVDEHNNTLLHKACERGYVDFACHLLKLVPQWSLDGRNEWALTPLMVLLKNHPEKAAPFVKEVADRGMRLNAHTPHGHTLLNTLIKSYSEVADDAPAGVKEGIEATIIVMLNEGARPFINDWSGFGDSRYNCAWCACFKYGIGKTRPLFGHLVRQLSTQDLWRQLDLMTPLAGMGEEETKHRLTMAALIVEEAALAEVDTASCRHVMKVLEAFEAARALQAIDPRDRPEFIALKKRCDVFMKHDSIDKYGFAIDAVEPEGIFGRYRHRTTMLIKGFTIAADQGSFNEFYSKRCGDAVLNAVRILKSFDQGVDVSSHIYTSMVEGKQIPHMVAISVKSIAQREIPLPYSNPSMFYESLHTAVVGLKADIGAYALKVQEVERFMSLTAKSNTQFFFREPRATVSKSFSPGPCQIGIYQIDDSALFFTGKFVQQKNTKYSWATVKKMLQEPQLRPQAFKGFHQVVKIPLVNFKDSWDSFLQSAPFNALKNSQWILGDLYSFKESITEWAPHLSPFVAQLEANLPQSYLMQFSDVDINMCTLSVWLCPSGQIDPLQRTSTRYTIPFWALADRVSLGARWPEEIVAEKITLSGAAFTLTATPPVEHTPQVNINDLLVARSLDVARCKAWHDQLMMSFGVGAVHDANVLTHFANILTSGPHPMQLPANLAHYINQAAAFNHDPVFQRLGTNQEVTTCFAHRTLCYLLGSLIEQFENMSTSDEESDKLAISSILSELREMAFDRGSAEERAAIQSLIDRQLFDAYHAFYEVQVCQTAVERARTHNRYILKEYAGAKESLAVILTARQRSDNPPLGVLLGTKRRADDQNTTSTSRRRLGPGDPKQAISFIESGGGDEWPELVQALQRKITCLQDMLRGVFELERSAAEVMCKYKSMVAAHEQELKAAKGVLMEARGWVRHDFQIAAQVNALAPQLSASPDSFPAMTLSYEAALGLLFRKGIIQHEPPVMQQRL